MRDALNVEIDSDNQVAICRPKGKIDTRFANELLNFLLALEEVSEHPFNRLLDLTMVTAVVLDVEEIIAYANARRMSTNHLPHFRCAIIARGPDAEAAGFLYGTLMKDSKIDVKVFREPGGAAEWLRVPHRVADPSLVGE